MAEKEFYEVMLFKYKDNKELTTLKNQANDKYSDTIEKSNNFKAINKRKAYGLNNEIAVIEEIIKQYSK